MKTRGFITCDTLFDAESITTSFMQCRPQSRLRCEVMFSESNERLKASVGGWGGNERSK